MARKAVHIDIPSQRPETYYGSLVFNRQKMFEYLPKHTYDALVKAIDMKEPLPRDLADSVAAGMKRWAIDNGARHYTHWFHPLTDGTAEKHDAFIEHDGKGGVVEEFNGKLLVQQEPDASSFPNGGIRNTFEARGYSAWDISSPAFIVDQTLCIPTIFISYTGESLDYKTPLLRALNAVDRAGTKVAQLFDPAVKHVCSYLGWEQEYFLVDEALFAARPDLVLTGRTLMGHESAKNQQLEDHYFGSIPKRVEAFMLDLEIEAHRLGIPAKTRHNEVAPNQFELAPIFEEANLANDHNLLLMSLMTEVGKTPAENLQFVTFVANTMAAVHRHNGLLKASIASATNAHRLGANEAPPAIISVFAGRQLSDLFTRIIDGDESLNFAGKEGVKIGVHQIPEIMVDNTDRNRTSPFAFTGNRFEFRAVGSSANCASALIALNAAVADQLEAFHDKVQKRISDGEDLNHAILSEVREILIESQNIHFDGNGYSDEWKAEAARRGLDCETSVPKIFDAYLRPESIEMFSRTGVFSSVELEARNEVKWEMYTKKVQIESRVLGDLALNHVLPVATRYQSILVDNLVKLRTLFPGKQGEKISAGDLDSIEKMAGHMTIIRDEVDKMIQARKEANQIKSEREKAIAYHDNVVPCMEAIRDHIDTLELMVDNEMWPLPKYRELLFIR